MKTKQTRPGFGWPQPRPQGLLLDDFRRPWGRDRGWPRKLERASRYTNVAMTLLDFNDRDWSIERCILHHMEI